jgi:hypothetical protein
MGETLAHRVRRQHEMGGPCMPFTAFEGNIQPTHILPHPGRDALHRGAGT